MLNILLLNIHKHSWFSYIVVALYCIIEVNRTQSKAGHVTEERQKENL